MSSVDTFKIGEKAVYAAHGVGEITDIQTKLLGGTSRPYYILQGLENNMKIMVPVETAGQAGLRAIISSQDGDKVMEILKSNDVSVTTQPWNRRHREYMEMLKSGSPFEVAKVLRDLSRMKQEKDLSFGERKLLETAFSLLVEELAISQQREVSEIEDQIKSIF